MQTTTILFWSLCYNTSAWFYRVGPTNIYFYLYTYMYTYYNTVLIWNYLLFLGPADRYRFELDIYYVLYNIIYTYIYIYSLSYGHRCRHRLRSSGNYKVYILKYILTFRYWLLSAKRMSTDGKQKTGGYDKPGRYIARKNK